MMTARFLVFAEQKVDLAILETGLAEGLIQLMWLNRHFPLLRLLWITVPSLAIPLKNCS